MDHLESHAASAPSGTILFTLVHGTFANGADWVKPGKSAFRPALEKALPEYHVEFDDGFSWGHDKWRYRDNFERTRTIGTQLLEKHVLRPRPEGPVLAHFLVAHSHGGNVALSALKNDEVRDSIDGLVCLATPFLFSRRRQLSLRLLCLSVFFVALLIFQLTQARMAPVLWWLQAAFAGISVAVTLAAFIDRISRWNRSGHDIVDRVVSTGLVDDRVGLLSEMPPQFPLLIIRPSGDEASGLLRMSQFVTWLLGKLLGALDKAAGFLIPVGLATAFGRQAVPQVAQWLGREDAVAAWMTNSARIYDYLNPVLGAVVGLGCLIIVLIAAQQLSFRFDRLQEFASVEPMVEDAPPGIKAQLLVLRPYTSPGLKLAHTQVYAKLETAQGIADWVRERLSQAGRTASIA